MGRRRIFEFGVAWFAVASLAAGGPDARVLIAARAVQGIGGALLTPGSLAILQASFTPDDRSRAIGAWSGFGGLAGAAGPLVGGYLLNVASWRWVFVINLPLAVAVLSISRALRSRVGDRASTGPDRLAGAAWAVLSLAGITYRPDRGSRGRVGQPADRRDARRRGGRHRAFVVTELRSRNPLVPPQMFVARQFAATNAVTLLVYAGLAGAILSAADHVAGGRPGIRRSSRVWRCCRSP